MPLEECIHSLTQSLILQQGDDLGQRRYSASPSAPKNIKVSTCTEGRKVYKGGIQQPFSPPLVANGIGTVYTSNSCTSTDDVGPRARGAIVNKPPLATSHL